MRKQQKKTPPPPSVAARGDATRDNRVRGWARPDDGPAEEEEETDQAGTKEGGKEMKRRDSLTCWGCTRRCPPGAAC